ncbi:MAG TPA: glycosyltransferase [Pseudonocardiaceae bacterium]
MDTARFTPSRRDVDLRARLLAGDGGHGPHGEHGEHGGRGDGGRGGSDGDGRLLVGYVGRLAPEKYVHHLAALDALPWVRLVVIGDGPRREALRRALPRAVFLGRLDGVELARAYASLDVFAHPGPHETFGQTVQEALASGVPVVAPDSGGPRDLVLPGRTGYLVPAGDAAALRSAVTELADPAVRAAFGVAARRSVLRRTWTAVCDELLHHYAAVTRPRLVTEAEIELLRPRRGGRSPARSGR